LGVAERSQAAVVELGARRPCQNRETSRGQQLWGRKVSPLKRKRIACLPCSIGIATSSTPRKSARPPQRRGSCLAPSRVCLKSSSAIISSTRQRSVARYSTGPFLGRPSCTLPSCSFSAARDGNPPCHAVCNARRELSSKMNAELSAASSDVERLRQQVRCSFALAMSISLLACFDCWSRLSLSQKASLQEQLEEMRKAQGQSAKEAVRIRSLAHDTVRALLLPASSFASGKSLVPAHPNKCSFRHRGRACETCRRI
jgi:hypothetical protein